MSSAWGSPELASSGNLAIVRAVPLRGPCEQRSRILREVEGGLVHGERGGPVTARDPAGLGGCGFSGGHEAGPDHAAPRTGRRALTPVAEAAACLRSRIYGTTDLSHALRARGWTPLRQASEQ